MTKFAIPPDAVRVWRGFRAPSMTLPEFFNRLGTVFIPATVQLQIKAGLDTYVPAVPAGLENKPDTVPDETAILFWDSQQTYWDGFNTLAVRTYTLTHGAVYAPGSRADFPQLFAGTVPQDQPVYLFPQSADWMHGNVTHFLGGRPANVTTPDFLTSAGNALKQIQSAGGINGAIACAGANYLVAWILSSADSDPAAAAIKALAAICDWSKTIYPNSTSLTNGLWDEWPGMSVNPGDAFNMQFLRRWEQ